MQRPFSRHTGYPPTQRHVLDHEEAGKKQATAHLPLPQPSIWPLLLSASITGVIVGALFIDQSPWVVLLALFFVLICILGWALEEREDQFRPALPLRSPLPPKSQVRTDGPEEEVFGPITRRPTKPTPLSNGLGRIRLLPF